MATWTERNKEYRIRLYDLIAELDEIQKSIDAGQEDGLQADLFNCWKLRQDILGGDELTRVVMDAFDAKWASIRTQLLA